MKVALTRSGTGGAAPGETTMVIRPTVTDKLIADLIRQAPDGASAWQRLLVGVDLERLPSGEVVVVQYLMSPERLRANQAALDLDHRIAQGWGFIGDKVDTGEPVPRQWIERLCELHDEQQDRLFELDAVRRAEWEAENLTRAESERRYIVSPLADVLHRACIEADHYLRDLEPAAPVNLSLLKLEHAIDDDDLEAGRLWAREYLKQAVWQRYSGLIGEEEAS